MSPRRLTATAIRSAAIAAATIAATAPATSAQYLGGGTKTAAETQIADLEQVRDKFLALAEAFPDSLYGWRPMEGVRSVRDVLVLIAAEGTLFPTMWDFPAPDWVADGGFQGELRRLGALSKDELIAELTRSFAYVLETLGGLTANERARQVNFFGLTVDLTTAATLMANDMHEHLGQSIAYARMNRIVPPWSRRGG